MISIKRNENFSNWYQVFSFGKLIDEINKKAKAVNFAKKLAKQSNQVYINIEGEATKI
jgi:hypothetical protein